MLKAAVFAIARRSVPCGHGAGTWLPLYILAQFVGGFAGAILGTYDEALSYCGLKLLRP